MNNVTTTLKDIMSFTGLNDSVTTILTALLILIVGAMIAKMIKKVVYKLLNRTKWDEKILGKSIGNLDSNSFVASLVYSLLMLMVLLVVLEVMGISQVLDPIKNMLNKFLGFIPNLLAGGVIAFVGYVIAKFVSNLVSMSGSFLDKIVEKTSFKDTDKIVVVLQKIVFIVILIPFIIQSLNALQLDAIAKPVNNVLSTVLGVIPNMLGAVVIIGVFVIGGKFLTGFLKDLLKSMGVDTLASKLQLSNIVGENQSFATIISNLVFFFLVFFGVITGVEMLGLQELNDILNNLLTLTGQILFGLVILVIGNFVSTLASNALKKSDSTFLASVVKVAVLGLFLAISLRTMGIANSIVELAFGLILGAVAVAFALAYGLGGREAAGEHMKEIIKKITNK